MAAKKGSDRCTVCNTAVSKKEQAVACEACERWCHIMCAGIDGKTYETLKAVDNLHWFCNECNGRVVKMLSDITQLQKKQEEMEKRQVDFEKGMRDLNTTFLGEVAIMREKVEKVVEEVQLVKDGHGKLEQRLAGEKARDKQIDELTAAFIQDGPWVVRKEVENEMNMGLRAVREDVEEKLEIERRKENLVIHGVPETDAERDIDTVTQILSLGLHLDFTRYVESMMRIGRVQTERPRPLRLKLKSQNARKEILARAKNLKESEDYKRMFITPDLTRKQQEADKELRMKLKEIREGGEPEAKIKFGKIVKNVGGRMEMVLFQPVRQK